jgi:hypothetical protein
VPATESVIVRIYLFQDPIPDSQGHTLVHEVEQQRPLHHQHVLASYYKSKSKVKEGLEKNINKFRATVGHHVTRLDLRKREKQMLVQIA